MRRGTLERSARSHHPFRISEPCPGEQRFESLLAGLPARHSIEGSLAIQVSLRLKDLPRRLGKVGVLFEHFGCRLADLDSLLFHDVHELLGARLRGVNLALVHLVLRDEPKAGSGNLTDAGLDSCKLILLSLQFRLSLCSESLHIQNFDLDSLGLLGELVGGKGIEPPLSVLSVQGICNVEARREAGNHTVAREHLRRLFAFLG